MALAVMRRRDVDRRDGDEMDRRAGNGMAGIDAAAASNHGAGCAQHLARETGAF